MNEDRYNDLYTILTLLDLIQRVIPQDDDTLELAASIARAADQCQQLVDTENHRLAPVALAMLTGEGRLTN